MTIKKSAAVRTALALLALHTAGAFAAKDYLVTGARPDLLVVVDAKERKVVKTYRIPNTSMGNGPSQIVPSRDGKVAYVTHNRWESVSGIDLESGAEVFRAELSESDIRGKSIYAMDISPDGKELAVYVNPTQLLPGEYKILDPYIAVYRTDAGKDAKPVRKLPASRRVSTLAYSGKGDTLYAFGWDILKIDPQTGKVKGSHPWRSWQRPNRGAPDALVLWPGYEQANVFAMPYYVPATDKPADDPGAFRAGIWALDLENDTVRHKEFEDASVILFSSVVNPVKRNEVFTVFNHLTRTDMETGKMERVDLAHSYYVLNVSSDGSEIYIGGTTDDIGVHDSKTLKRIGTIRMPGGAEMVMSSFRVFSR